MGLFYCYHLLRVDFSGEEKECGRLLGLHSWVELEGVDQLGERS